MPSPVKREPTDRRTALLDAALRLIGNRGLRAVTHRAVQEEAGLPHGSVTYYFKTREQLIVAVVERLVELDRERIADLTHEVAMALAAPAQARDLEPLAEAVGAWVDQDPVTQLARYELLLAGAHDETVRKTMSAGATTFWRMCEPIALATGSTHTARDARIMVAMLDGLLLDRLTRDPAAPDVSAEGLRRLLLPPAHGTGTRPEARG